MSIQQQLVGVLEAVTLQEDEEIHEIPFVFTLLRPDEHGQVVIFGELQLALSYVPDFSKEPLPLPKNEEVEKEEKDASETTDAKIKESNKSSKSNSNMGWFPQISFGFTSSSGAKFYGATFDVAIENSPTDVPLPLAQAIEYIEKNGGLVEEGIFRVPGNNLKIKEIKEAYEEGKEVEFPDVHDAGGALKLYLRDGNPLIPFSSYPKFLVVWESFKDAAGRIQKFSELCSQLPEVNYRLFKLLLNFLRDVAANADKNLMVTRNLAVVFAPNVLRPEVETMHAVMVEMKITIEVVGFLIDHTEEILTK